MPCSRHPCSQPQSSQPSPETPGQIQTLGRSVSSPSDSQEEIKLSAGVVRDSVSWDRKGFLSS